MPKPLRQPNTNAQPMNPYILIPLILGLIMVPIATGGNPLRAWGQSLALTTIFAGIYASIYAITA